MRFSRWVLVSAVLIAGCFEEGGDNVARDKAVSTVVQGLIAFGDIQSNIQTDPAKAGEALMEFMKWPVAADTLISPPFEGADMVMDATSPRLPPNSPVPDCLLQTGEPACELYATSDVCEAGAFTFTGIMNRKCAKCDDPRGLCSYAWQLVNLKLTFPDDSSLNVDTAGSWVGTTGQITPNTTASYALRYGKRSKVGVISACACTPFTVVDSPTESGKPRKLVNSSFIVRAPFNREQTARACAFVSFDGNGDVKISDACTCDSSSNACDGPDPLVLLTSSCGNGVCEAAMEETPATCSVDCALNPAVCGNDVCEIGESYTTCPADCYLP